MRYADEYTCPKCQHVFRAGAADVFRHGDTRACPACRAQVLIDLPPPPWLPLDPTPYGLSLAERVAAYLQAGGEIPQRHPYFHGVCLARLDDTFLYGYAQEGGAPAFAFPDSSSVIRRFDNRAEFVAWLAAQSDDRLTRALTPGWSRATSD